MQFSQKVCEHKQLNSTELTHQHKGFEQCMVCAISFQSGISHNFIHYLFHVCFPNGQLYVANKYRTMLNRCNKLFVNHMASGNPNEIHLWKLLFNTFHISQCNMFFAIFQKNYFNSIQSDNMYYVRFDFMAVFCFIARF